MNRAVAGFLAAAWAVAIGGCHSAPKVRDYTPMEVRFYLEASPGDGTPLTLPQSSVHVSVNPKPVITEGDVVNVELVKVDLGLCLLFQLTPGTVRDFYRLSATHQGRRLVLLVDGVAIGFAPTTTMPSHRRSAPTQTTISCVRSMSRRN